MRRKSKLSTNCQYHHCAPVWTDGEQLKERLDSLRRSPKRSHMILLGEDQVCSANSDLQSEHSVSRTMASRSMILCPSRSEPNFDNNNTALLETLIRQQIESNSVISLINETKRKLPHGQKKSLSIFFDLCIESTLRNSFNHLPLSRFF
ncbi:hypothetical protein D918_02631 [Trichuris suis]|nr:hypothetical protein D918_02631 [Trichuris suis]